MHDPICIQLFCVVLTVAVLHFPASRVTAGHGELDRSSALCDTLGVRERGGEGGGGVRGQVVMRVGGSGVASSCPQSPHISVQGLVEGLVEGPEVQGLLPSVHRPLTPVTAKLVLYRLPCRVSGIVGSVQGLVCLVSVYCVSVR